MLAALGLELQVIDQLTGNDDKVIAGGFAEREAKNATDLIREAPLEARHHLVQRLGRRVALQEQPNARRQSEAALMSSGSAPSPNSTSRMSL